MEYSILELAKLAGCSTRTLRYYDEIGILKPARSSFSGYRIYGEQEVDRLQEIFFFKEMGVGLAIIKDILSAPSYERSAILSEHRDKLLAKRKELDLLIVNVEKSIAAEKGEINMKDDEKFSGFKQKLLEENEKRYGEEIRSKYGEKEVNKSNSRFREMTSEQYTEMERLSREMLDVLKSAVQTGDPGGEAAQKAADLHRQWLTLTWGHYTPEAHAGLAQMYVEDERFSNYYDQVIPGAAVFLRDAITVFTEKLLRDRG